MKTCRILLSTISKKLDKTVEVSPLKDFISIDKIQLKVNDIEIMNAKYHSYCVLINIENNKLKNYKEHFIGNFQKKNEWKMLTYILQK